ncbi:MAG: 4Fe-4S ferredoxin [Elusimicrobia bacterium]|nr:MAG: 4Fe-4S ferredoxin [Elusimicrobiota bacterium]
MPVLRLMAAGFGLWLLAAHFLRGGHVLLAAALAAAPAALFIRSPVSRRLVQAALVAGALVWLSTAVRLAHDRRAEGRPWARMAVILGAVASVNALGAALLEGRRSEAWFASTAKAD